MLFMEENERNATGKLVVSSVPYGQAVGESVQLWYIHVRRLYLQCVDKRYVQYAHSDHGIQTYLLHVDDQNTCLFQCDILHILG